MDAPDRQEPNTRFPSHWVCFTCRKTFSGPASPLRRCPQCAAPMLDMGVYFEAPRNSDRQLWNALKDLAATGFRFTTERSYDRIFGKGSEGRKPSRRTVASRIRYWLEAGIPPDL